MRTRRHLRLQPFFNGRGIADQDQAGVARQFTGGKHGTPDGDIRPVVATHDVQSDPHLWMRLARVVPDHSVASPDTTRRPL
jgi:hypothetical protein